MLEKRAHFREATKNLLVFKQEEMEEKKEKAKKKVSGYCVYFIVFRISPRSPELHGLL